jgi:hypothetical protein
MSFATAFAKRLTRRAAATALLLALAGPAFAQQAPLAPSHLALAREFVEVSGGAATFEGVIPGIIDQIRGGIGATNPDLLGPLGEIATQLRTEFAPRRSQVIDIVAQAYARRFTEAEMRDIVAFFKSPSGQKFVRTQPEVLRDSFGIANEWATKLSEELQARMRAELRRRGHNL